MSSELLLLQTKRKIAVVSDQYSAVSPACKRRRAAPGTCVASRRRASRIYLCGADPDVNRQGMSFIGQFEETLKACTASRLANGEDAGPDATAKMIAQV